MEKKRKGPGRPRNAFKTRLFSTRIRVDVAALLADIAKLDNRSTSAQLAVAAEFYVAANAGRLNDVKK